MATTIEPVKLPANTWVDLYAATGITVGNQISLQGLIQGREIKLSESDSEPTSAVGFNLLVGNEFFINNASAVGAWAYSVEGSVIQVNELSTGGA